jgi:SAM-dependent methyltransferase
VTAPLRADAAELERVASYYDAFADVAEQRYASNPVLARVRHGFRSTVERYPAEAMLDLGCGPGTDIAYFAKRYPQRRYRGIDLSPRMVDTARANLRAVPGVRVERGCAADAPQVFSGERFDVVYSFFGPLNTEPDLRAAAQSLRTFLSPGGILALSFVSRVYLVDSLLHLLRGRPRRAAARLLDRWGGYSDNGPLSTHLYFPRQLEAIFAFGFRVEKREGFSILYPAWYRAARFRAGGSALRALWLGDRALNRTPLWFAGEHLLYVFRAVDSEQ